MPAKRRPARGEPEHVAPEGRDTEFAAVLESAARLQRLVPDSVLVGGSAAAVYAGHRLSLDHDHVVGDLAARFDMVLEALEADGGWATNRLVYGKVILGNLDGIEAGVRQMIRKTPLETVQLALPSGQTLVVPTVEETLRIKAFLVLRRNYTRDYLDVAALAASMGTSQAADVLRDLDAYYADQRGEGDEIATQVARQLADPRPKDIATTRQLTSYRKLDQRWTDWNEVRRALSDVAKTMLREADR